MATRKLSDSPSPPSSSSSPRGPKRIKRPSSFFADQAAQDSSQSIVTTCNPILSDVTKIRFVGGIQAVPDTEHNLHQLRDQRLKARENSLFVPPQAKPTFQSSDDALVPLMEMTLEFLSGSGQVLLLLGDSGGGKSTFNLQLEHTLWKAYKRDGAIPLHINLPAIDNPKQNMIAKQLQQLNFSDVQIQELKQNRQFIIICDGYDESQLKKNIYATNLLNQPGQWRAKMIISCRSQYLGSDYRSRFQPSGDPYQQPTINLFHEAVIASFSRSQIEQYVEQYVEQLAQKAPSQAAGPTLPSWTVKDYMDKLNKIPKMIELVSNPFILTLALRALPKVVLSAEKLSSIRLTRIELYDNFIEQWLETNKQRLEASALSMEAEETFEALLNDGFVQQGVRFQKDLATAIFQYQSGTPVVEYSHLRERRTWKALFFGPDSQAMLLRESSPLTRSGSQYRFLHRSILEYLYSRVMSDSFKSSQLSAHGESGAIESIESVESVESFLDHPLNQRSIADESSILQFLAERAGLDPLFKSRLFAAVEESKVDARVSQAAANAISILVRAGVQFNGADLREIRIPGADIQGGQFDSADMEGTDLSNVNMSKAWLRQANLKGAQMGGVQFGELPYLAMGARVMRCVFSPDGALLAVSTNDSIISVYNTATWAKIADYIGGYTIAISPTTRELAKEGCGYVVEVGDILTDITRLVLEGHSDHVRQIAYSLDGSLIATASDDTTVRIWSTESGYSLHVLRDHTDIVHGVAFSPSGLHLVSCSQDRTIRTWDTKIGEPLLTFERHKYSVTSVSYSPDGCQIASADEGGTIVLWDVHAGKIIRDLTSSHGMVDCVAYSLDGYQIASCGFDATIRLWNPRNGEMVGKLSGHKHNVNYASYSPKGDLIASGSADGTVRLWEVGRVLPSATPGVMDGLRSVDMSPDSLQTVTVQFDGSRQLWETQTGKAGPVLPGHADSGQSVLFSPCGERIASADQKGTIRLWCARTGESVHSFESHKPSSASSCVFSPNGRQIATAGKDNTVRFWDAKTGEPGLVLEGHTDDINSLAFSPSGDHIASCSSDMTVRLWCSLTGDQVKIVRHLNEVSQVEFSPDGQELVSLMGDGVLCCWDSRSGECIDVLLSEGHFIVFFSFSPCGNLIVTGGFGGILQLWGRTLDGWTKVFRSSVGKFFDARWRQDSNERMYLATRSFDEVSVWELSESGGSYNLRMLWRLGKDELSMKEANMCGVVGLSTSDLVLMKQREAILESGSENEESESENEE